MARARRPGCALLTSDALDDLAARLDAQRGVIVAGGGAGDPEAVHRLAAAAQWPVLADPRSGARLPRPTTVGAFDGLLRHRGFAADHTPDGRAAPRARRRRRRC